MLGSFRVHTERSKDLTELGQSLFCQPRTVLSHFNEDSFSFRPKEVLKWAVTHGCSQRDRVGEHINRGKHLPVLPWEHNCMSWVDFQLHGIEAGMVQNFIPSNVSQGPSSRQLTVSTHQASHRSHHTCCCHPGIFTHTHTPYLLLFFQSPNQISILRPSRLGQIPFWLDLHSSHFLLYTLS